MTRLRETACPKCGHLPADDQKASPFCPECRFPLRLVAGKYRLLKRLARGGGGTVYLAHHMSLTRDKERVVKIIHPECLEVKELYIRFQREVEITAMLSQRNQHIVRIYDDFGEEPWIGAFYVMEYLQGTTLKQLVRKKGPLPLFLVKRIFQQLCQAIAAAHQEGIIHRDLKPPNIFLVEHESEPYFVKVIDFGIAKNLEAHTQHDLTQGSMGTPTYMSPEQCMNETIDGRADIYSMGCILYEMLTGNPPFEIPGDTSRPPPWAIMQRHINEAPPPLKERCPTLHFPDGIEETVMHALHKKPEHRYPDVNSFWQAIDQAIPNEHFGALAGSAAEGLSHDNLAALPHIHTTSHEITQHTPMPQHLWTDPPAQETHETFPSGHIPTPEEFHADEHELFASTTPTKLSALPLQLSPVQTPRDTRLWIAAIALLLVLLVFGIGWGVKRFSTSSPGLLDAGHRGPSVVARSVTSRPTPRDIRPTPPHRTSKRDGLACQPKATRPCYTGPAQTKAIGQCQPGLQRCLKGAWTPCENQQLPQPEICNDKDDNCDGKIDEIFPNIGQTCTQQLSGCRVSGLWRCHPTRQKPFCQVASPLQPTPGQKPLQLRLSPSRRISISYKGRTILAKQRACLHLPSTTRVTFRAPGLETCILRLSHSKRRRTITLKPKSDLGEVHDYCK